MNGLKKVVKKEKSKIMSISLTAFELGKKFIGKFKISLTPTKMGIQHIKAYGKQQKAF